MTLTMAQLEDARDLAVGLMRGDERSFHLGYSIGNALIAVAEKYEASPKMVAILAEAVVDETGRHYSSTRRPLVIVEVDGGVVQNTLALPGLGTPLIHVLDYDREGQTAEELDDFVADLRAALRDLRAHGSANPDAVDDLAEAVRRWADRADEVREEEEEE